MKAIKKQSKPLWDRLSELCRRSLSREEGSRSRSRSRSRASRSRSLSALSFSRFRSPPRSRDSRLRLDGAAPLGEVVVPASRGEDVDDRRSSPTGRASSIRPTDARRSLLSRSRSLSARVLFSLSRIPDPDRTLLEVMGWESESASESNESWLSHREGCSSRSLDCLLRRNTR